MSWPKAKAVALSVAMATVLVATPSALAGDGEREAKAAQATKEHAKKHGKEHPKEHPDAAEHRLAMPLLEVFALEHAGQDLADVVEDMLPQGSRVAFHHPTGKLVVLTDDRGMGHAQYLIEQLDVPASRASHDEGECEACRAEHAEHHDAHGDEHGDEYPEDGDDVDEDGDEYPEEGDDVEEEEDCDEYPEDGDGVDDDDDEEAAAPGPLTKESLAVAIKAHIEDATKAQGGAFHIEDTKAGVTLALTLDKVHEERLATMGDGVYFACSDFKAANGQVFDVDFFMKDDDGDLAMTELHIHKEDGVARYTWHENDGVWSRREVQ